MLDSRLKKVLKEKDTKPVNLDKKKKRRKILKRTLIIIGSCLGAILGFIYIPVLFWPSPAADPELTRIDNQELIEQVIKNHANEDFDGDGLSNAEEMKLGTNPYYIDSDDDGMTDFFEYKILDTDPDGHTSISKGYDLPDGTSTNTPFSQNGIILWPDNLSSRVRVGIANTIYGQYRFTNFTGWAHFSHGKYAYKLKDGIRTPLKYKDIEDAYYIDEDMVVELFDKELEVIHRFNIFGNEHYSRQGFWSDLWANVLPDKKGFLQGQTMTRLDIVPDTDMTYRSKISEINYELNDNRFTKNDNKLRDFTDILESLAQDRCVLVSLYSVNKGESLGIIYQYTQDGYFLIQDYNDPQIITRLKIKENTSQCLTSKNNAEPLYIFDFEGGGYSSYDGDCISILAASITQ